MLSACFNTTCTFRYRDYTCWTSFQLASGQGLFLQRPLTSVGGSVKSRFQQVTEDWLFVLVVLAQRQPWFPSLWDITQYLVHLGKQIYLLKIVVLKLCVSEWPGGLVPRVSHLESLGWGLRINISDKFPGGARATGAITTPRELLPYTRAAEGWSPDQ